MAKPIFTQGGHLVQGLPAVADAFSGTVRSDVVSMKNHAQVEFLVHKAVGATGTSTITVNACDDVVPSNRTAIPFRYRANTTGDTWGAVTEATTAGFTTTGGSNQMYEVIVDGDQLGDPGYGYVELTAVEVVDSPVLGGILILLQQPRYASDVPATVLT